MINYSSLVATRLRQEMIKVSHELHHKQVPLYSYSKSDKECSCASARHIEMYTKKEFVQIAKTWKEISAQHVQNNSSED